VMRVQSELGEDRPSLALVARVLGVPRSTVYYHPQRRKAPELDELLSARIKGIIERYPRYGYRRVHAVLRNRDRLAVNRKKVQRILQRRGWIVHRRPAGKRPRAQGLPSAVALPNRLWATDMAHLFCGQEGWCHLALVIDCGDRELIGWRLSRSGKATIAEAALEDALIQRFGLLRKAPRPLTLRSDNGLVFTSKRYRATARLYGLHQEFITLYTPEQNGVMERFIRSLKEECVWLHRFENLEHARKGIGNWIEEYNTERPHQELQYLPPRLWSERWGAS
jgi:putative transposase